MFVLEQNLNISIHGDLFFSFFSFCSKDYVADLLQIKHQICSCSSNTSQMQYINVDGPLLSNALFFYMGIFIYLLLCTLNVVTLLS